MGGGPAPSVHGEQMLGKAAKNGTTATRGMRLKEGEFSNGLYGHSDPMVSFTDPISYTKRLAYNPVFES